MGEYGLRNKRELWRVQVGGGCCWGFGGVGEGWYQVGSWGSGSWGGEEGEEGQKCGVVWTAGVEGVWPWNQVLGCGRHGTVEARQPGQAHAQAVPHAAAAAAAAHSTWRSCAGRW